MKSLRDQIVLRLMRVGCSDAQDLANEIEQEESPENIFRALQVLETLGVVERVYTPWEKLVDTRQWVYAIKK